MVVPLAGMSVGLPRGEDSGCDSSFLPVFVHVMSS